MSNPNDAYGLSKEYWGRLSPRDRELYAAVRPLRRAAYKVNLHISRLGGDLCLYVYGRHTRVRDGCLDFRVGAVIQ